MADDGSFKGHGGKPGRKSTVISMSAHKNRHAAEAEAAAKNLAGLTLFDFSAADEAEDDQPPAAKSSKAQIERESGRQATADTTPETTLDPARVAGQDSPREPGREPGREVVREPAREVVREPAREVVREPAREVVREPARDVVREPAKASPTAGLKQSNPQMAKPIEGALPCENTPFERPAAYEADTAPAPGRKFLRWGLEDGGLPGDLSVREIFEEEITPASAGQYIQSHQSQKESKNRERWQHKAGRSESVIESFYHAFHGLWVGFCSQRNVRIHCCIALGVIVLALIVKIDAISWLALSLATGFVFFAEYVNTAIEHVTDIQANYRYHRSARFAKDTAAAAVLVAAMTAVLIGLIVFVPRFIAIMAGQP